MPTLLATLDHGQGRGPEQNPLGCQRDTHSEEACSSMASKTMDYGRHGTKDNAGVNLPNPHLPGELVLRISDSMLSTMRAESNNAGLNPPCLQATGEPI
jgi:hypothetical protein